MPTDYEQRGVKFYYKDPDTGELFQLSDDPPNIDSFNIIADVSELVRYTVVDITMYEQTFSFQMPFKEYKRICREVMKNNWLKMHGYPKRRSRAWAKLKR